MIEMRFKNTMSLLPGTLKNRVNLYRQLANPLAS
jgi:hypothetical protein